MKAHLNPSYNPSRWSERAVNIALATAGCAIATYLSMYQMGFISRVWEPFFGDGSAAVLHSSLSRLLPVPDALLGAIAYFLEILLGALGGRERWRTEPWIVAMYGLVAASLGLVAIMLVLYQAFFVNAWCTLCLASAAVSVAIVISAAPEVLAAYRHMKL